MGATTTRLEQETAVRFRYRRRPPALAIGCAVGVLFAILAIGANASIARVLLAVAAVAAVLLGVLAWRRLWAEDQIITTTSVAVRLRNGDGAEIPFTRIDRIALRGNGLAFIRDDGAELRFSRNPHSRRMEEILRVEVPTAAWVDEVPIACDT